MSWIGQHIFCTRITLETTALRITSADRNAKSSITLQLPLYESLYSYCSTNHLLTPVGQIRTAYPLSVSLLRQPPHKSRNRGRGRRARSSGWYTKKHDT